MERRVISLVLLVVLASGCISTSNSPDAVEPSVNETSTPTQLSEDNNTIVFTDSGFSPASITVEKGETVNWINNASKSMWIASDRHPTHTRYSDTTRREHCQNGDQNTAAFDQCSTGERFSFSFEKVGEWGYHNHNPYVQGGKVTVVE